jgi:hypothetical protein
VAAAVGLGGVLAVAGLVYWQLPSRAEIAALQAERDELAAQVAAFEKRGGRAELTRCVLPGEKTGRPCVRIDPKAGIFGANGKEYRVLWGY